MADIVVSGVSKSFGDNVALRDVSLKVRDREFLTLVGPSGCGKSTLLRIIAGLEPQTGGTVAIGDRRVDALRPKDRNVAMVFQSYALYPYMTGAENIALPLKMQHLNRWQRLPFVGRHLPGARRRLAHIEERVRDVAAMLDIADLLGRRPAQMSGGQRQRVALGRAMVRNPQVFLMDEPLSNLDAKLRVRMRAEIADLHRRLGTTFIYVTHDQAEAMTMSDRVAVMMDGDLLQIGTPAEIYADPQSLRVAGFIGSPQINLLPGVLGLQGIDLAGCVMPLAGPPSAPAGDRVTVGVRPESLVLGRAARPPRLAGEVRHLEHLGSDVFVHIDWPGSDQYIVGRVAPSGLGGIAVGARLEFGFDPADALLFDAEGRRLQPAATAAIHPSSIGG